jgi:hypothetical protein
MEALVYLTATSIKNTLNELKNKPVLTAFYALLIVGVLGSATMTARLPTGSMGKLLPYPLETLCAGTFALILFMVISTALKGLDTGGSFFAMSDVNLLFVSPLSPTHILFYGMVRQAGMALFGGLAILAQIVNLQNFFGVGWSAAFSLFFGYALSMVAAQGLAVLLYSFSHGSPRRKMLVQGLGAALLLPLVVMGSAAIMEQGAWAVLGVLNSTYAYLIPIAGWTAGGLSAILAGRPLVGLGLFSLNLLLFVSTVILLGRHGRHYYEDVLVATETSAALREARKMGDPNDPALRRGGGIKGRGSGVQGWGASALMGRHLREAMRTNRFVVLDTYSFTILFIAAGMTFINSRSVPPIEALLFTFVATLYMQLSFMMVTGPIRELTHHYIFLIPDSPMQKLIYNNGFAALKALAESVLIYTVVGIMLRISPITLIAAILANTGFCIMLLGINVWGLRFFGTTINRGLLMIIYLLIGVAAILPGLMGIMMLSMSNPGWGKTLVVPGLLLTVYELIAALLFAYLSRDVLHHTDLIQLTTGKAGRR